MPDSVRGWYDAIKGTVSVNGDLDHARRRSTLAHELIHADRGDTHRPDLLDEMRQEISARVNAARFLINLRDLADVLADSASESEAARRLRVDVQTLRRRIATLAPEEIDYLEAVARRRTA